MSSKTSPSSEVKSRAFKLAKWTSTDVPTPWDWPEVNQLKQIPECQASLCLLSTLNFFLQGTCLIHRDLSSNIKSGRKDLVSLYLSFPTCEREKRNKINCVKCLPCARHLAGLSTALVLFISHILVKNKWTDEEWPYKYCWIFTKAYYLPSVMLSILQMFSQFP